MSGRAAAKRHRGGGAAGPLHGCTVVISGIVNPERGELRQMAMDLGARSTGVSGPARLPILSPPSMVRRAAGSRRRRQPRAGHPAASW
jgi:hypothetical protein